jgi:hypothetical protein
LVSIRDPRRVGVLLMMIQVLPAVWRHGGQGVRGLPGACCARAWGVDGHVFCPACAATWRTRSTRWPPAIIQRPAPDRPSTKLRSQQSNDAGHGRVRLSCPPAPSREVADNRLAPGMHLPSKWTRSRMPPGHNRSGGRSRIVHGTGAGSSQASAVGGQVFAPHVQPGTCPTRIFTSDPSHEKDDQKNYQDQSQKSATDVHFVPLNARKKKISIKQIPLRPWRRPRRPPHADRQRWPSGLPAGPGCRSALAAGVENEQDLS